MIGRQDVCCNITCKHEISHHFTLFALLNGFSCEDGTHGARLRLWSELAYGVSPAAASSPDYKAVLGIVTKSQAATGKTVGFDRLHSYILQDLAAKHHFFRIMRIWTGTKLI